MVAWKRLLEPDIQAFIAQHSDDDVAALALKKTPDSTWPMPLILDQIKARQKAARKIPLWLERDGVVLPSADTLEQASSAATAHYKAQLFAGRTFVDLTAGCGVDACALAEHYESGVCVERDEGTSSRLAHNLPLLADVPVDVHHGSAEEYVVDMPVADLVMIDPQRRNESRKGLYRLADCAPDVTTLLPVLRGKAKAIIIKTSPMADIQALARELAPVSQIYIVEVQGECKELVFVWRQDAEPDWSDVPITAVRLSDEGTILSEFTYTKAQEESAQVPLSEPLAYIYEPSPAVMKAGGYKALADRFGLKKLHPHTHLYTADNPVAVFPGRSFALQSIHPASGKGLDIKKANVSTRNFPLSAVDLRKKLKLHDGGADTITGCTLHDGRKVLLHLRPNAS